MCYKALELTALPTWRMTSDGFRHPLDTELLAQARRCPRNEKGYRPNPDLPVQPQTPACLSRLSSAPSPCSVLPSLSCSSLSPQRLCICYSFDENTSPSPPLGNCYSPSRAQLTCSLLLGSCQHQPPQSHCSLIFSLHGTSQLIILDVCHFMGLMSSSPAGL